MLMLDHKHLHKAINRLSKFYKSTILGFYLAGTPVVVLNDSEKVKKALNHRDFDGKPDLLLGRLRDPNLNLHGL